MTGGKLEIAYWFIATSAAVIVLIVIGILISKAVHSHRRKMIKLGERRLKVWFAHIQHRLDQEGPLPLPKRKLRSYERMVARANLTTWIERSGGESRKKLIALCEELGFVGKEIARLRSFRHMRRTRAAYRLGQMRSKQAAPMLLAALEKQSFGPGLFVTARAVAHCARDTRDLDVLVQNIVKHGKQVHAITAAILEEYDGDLTQWLLQLTTHQQSEVRQIAHRSLYKRAGEPRIAAPTHNVIAIKDAAAGRSDKKADRAI